MKKLLLGVALSSLGLMAAVTSSAVTAADVFVITNNATNLSADDIKDVFIGEKQVGDGVKLTPIDNGSLKNDFLDKALHLTADKYTAIWVKKGFRDGLTAPASKGSDQEVIAIVKSKPGAVGYVSKASADVKVIKKF